MAEVINVKPLFIRYASPKRDYFVYEVASLGGNSRKRMRFIMVFRNHPQLNDNKEYTATGEWVSHKKYGIQFSAASLLEKEPESERGMIQYLLSLNINGLGEKTAQRIVGKFGRDTLDIIDEAPEKLATIPGITPKRIGMILSNWPEERKIRALSLYLADLGVSISYAKPIYDYYKDNWKKKIEENPYDLYFHIRGIGFKRADDIALRLGMQMEGIRTFHQVRRSAKVDETTFSQTPLIVLSPKGKATHDYKVFVHNLIEICEGQEGSDDNGV